MINGNESIIYQTYNSDPKFSGTAESVASPLSSKSSHITVFIATVRKVLLISFSHLERCLRKVNVRRSNRVGEYGGAGKF